MKFRETEFAKQLFYTIVGTLFLVASLSFFSITASAGSKLDGMVAATGSEWHLT